MVANFKLLRSKILQDELRRQEAIVECLLQCGCEPNNPRDFVQSSRQVNARQHVDRAVNVLSTGVRISNVPMTNINNVRSAKLPLEKAHVLLQLEEAGSKIV